LIFVNIHRGEATTKRGTSSQAIEFVLRRLQP
jgi:hypothetical protein